MFSEPIFHVVNDGLYLLGLPKHCKRTGSLYNEYLYEYEPQSTAASYIPIPHSLPWINGMLSERCDCKTEVNNSSIPRYTKGIIFSNDEEVFNYLSDSDLHSLIDFVIYANDHR